MDTGRARLFIDEDVHGALAAALRELGYDAVTAHECGRSNRRIEDEDQLAFAVSQGRMLVSHNIGDYHILDAAWRRQDRAHCGILVGPQRLSFTELSGGVRDAIAKYQEDVGGYVMWF